MDVVDLNNNKVGSVELPDAVFGVEVNQALLHQSVHHFQAGRRAGTHKTKVRGEVSGSGKKLWRQKGTGRARIGSIRSPMWRHGGTVHGPEPRDYSLQASRKRCCWARCARRFRRGWPTARSKCQGVSSWPATRRGEFSEILTGSKRAPRCCWSTTATTAIWRLSSRNMPGVTLMRGRDLHPYHLLRPRAGDFFRRRPSKNAARCWR